jgi:LPS O-antigen subunit length determinant protein (WzzB/FepE family)
MNNNDLDLQILLNIIFKEKWVIISLTSVASIFIVIYSLFLPNIYQSQALLSPAKSGDMPSSSFQRYNSLASIAGLNLPAQTPESNASKAIKKINTLSFFENNVLPEIFLPDLMAVKSWNAKKNKLEYDKNIYNQLSNTWVRDVSFPKTSIPSAQESYRKFKDMHLSISEDAEMGFITIKIKHKSPYIAKEWAALLVNEINKFYRYKDKAEAERAVAYLNKQIIDTNFSEIKLLIAALIQQETQKLTLIEANSFYVYEFIDPPAVMERKSEPSRALICVLGAIISGMLSICFVLFKYYFFTNSNHKKIKDLT